MKSDPVGPVERPRRALLRDEHRTRQPLDQVEERLGRRRDRAGTSARPAAATSVEAPAPTRGIPAAARPPRARRSDGRQAVRRRRWRAPRRPEARSRPDRRRCSRARRRPRSRPSAITAWSSGSWKTEATVPTSRAGSRLARIGTADDDPSGEDAAVEVRDEPRDRPQERRLPRARRAEQRDVLALGDLERDAVEHRRARRHRRSEGRRTATRATRPPPRSPPHRARPHGRAASRRARRPRPAGPAVAPRLHRLGDVEPSFERAGQQRREQPRADFSSTPRPRRATRRSRASRSSSGSRRVASATATVERRAQPAPASSRS